jgi:predicted transcriptional regulator
MSKIIDFEEAEKKARVRDSKIDEIVGQAGVGLTAEQQKALLQVLQNVTGEDYFIGKRKKRTDGVKFVQLIQDNWDYVIENKYLTDEEILFLMRIQRKLAFKSNCIVFDIHQKEQVPMTQKDIADFLKTDKAKVSKIVRSLTEKGIIVRAIGHKREGVNARAYSLYINPNLMICGDKEKIEETLKMLFINAKEKTKDFPIQLF